MSLSQLDFSGTRLSFDRPISSYTKVQAAYGSFLRWRNRLPGAHYTPDKRFLNVGCGPNQKEQFVNIDYWWQPGIDVCCDITAGIPLPAGCVDGIFTEHCLEHITFEQCQKALAEFRRLLAPKGVLRVVVPDAELFLNLYKRHREGEAVEFPYHDEYPEFTSMMHVNRIFRNHGHLFAYDFETMKRHFESAGFVDVRREHFRTGRTPILQIDSEHRACESLYVEAVAE